MWRTTGFGDGSRTYLKSFRNWRATARFFDDFDDNALNEKIDGWWRASSVVTFACRKADDTISATNPEWQGNVWVVQAPLLTASFGAASGGTINFQGDGDLTRDVTA